MGKLNNRLLAAVRQNDMETARLEQRRSQAVIRLLEKYGEWYIQLEKETELSCEILSPVQGLTTQPVSVSVD